MHTPGHSALGGQHSTRREQYRMRDTAQKQQRRHIPSIDAHSEVQAQPGAVTGSGDADQLPPRHRLPR
jgi:hypothetical protein